MRQKRGANAGAECACAVAPCSQRSCSQRHALTVEFTSLAGYDEEARYFEAGVRRAKREELVARARGLVRGAYDAQLEPDN